MSTRQYEWHAERVFFLDRVNRQRHDAIGFVLAWRSVADGGAKQNLHVTGLGYHSQYRKRELPPMYVQTETHLGAYGSYYPVHLPSGEQLVSAAWSNEATIRWFLQQLVEQSPCPDYWMQEAYPGVLDRFPGGRSAIALLEQFSVCQEIVRQQRGGEGQGMGQLREFFQRATNDQRLDEQVRSDLADLSSCFVGVSTWQESIHRLECAALGLMPPTMSQKAGIYHQALTILRGEEGDAER